MTPIVLASSSPRRRELLGRLGLAFTVVAPDVPETLPDLPLEQAVAALARRKADAAAPSCPDGALVIAADTIVVLDGRVMGKPADAAEAASMLKSLSGRTHEVLTGVCLLRAGAGEVARFTSAASVTFETLPPALIAAYVATGESLDKAGAYGGQGMGASFVKRVEGSWDAVVGLPLCEVREALHSAGIPPSAFYAGNGPRCGEA